MRVKLPSDFRLDQLILPPDLSVSLVFGDSDVEIIGATEAETEVIINALKLTSDELRRNAYHNAFTNDEAIEAVIEYILENRPDKLQIIQQKRNDIKQKFPVQQE